MGRMSVSQAAGVLGVNVQRVHQRIADGSLRAELIGRQWAVDEADLARLDRRPAGRPLSVRSAWLLVALAEQSELSEVGLSASASERSRGRGRLRDLLADALDVSVREEFAAKLRAALRNRADRRLFSASARDLPDLRADQRLRVSGMSSELAGIASADIVEGYVDGADLGRLVKDYLLVESSPVDANVVLHVVAQAYGSGSLVASPLVVAADLAEHHRPREDARAVELVRNLAVELGEKSNAPAR